MTERRKPAFGITVYRDEDGEANVESKFMGTAWTAELAIAEAQRVGPTLGWGLWTASVDEGEVVERLVVEDGVWLHDFETDPGGRKWYIGPTWIEAG